MARLCGEFRSYKLGYDGCVDGCMFGRWHYANNEHHIMLLALRSIIPKCCSCISLYVVYIFRPWRELIRQVVSISIKCEEKRRMTLPMWSGRGRQILSDPEGSGLADIPSRGGVGKWNGIAKQIKLGPTGSWYLSRPGSGSGLGQPRSR